MTHAPHTPGPEALDQTSLQKAEHDLQPADHAAGLPEAANSNVLDSDVEEAADVYFAHG